MALGKQNVRAACRKTKLAAGIQVFYGPRGIGGGCRGVYFQGRGHKQGAKKVSFTACHSGEL